MGHLESNLSQFPLSDSAKTMYHRPAIPTVVSTPLDILPRVNTREPHGTAPLE